MIKNYTKKRAFIILILFFHSFSFAQSLCEQEVENLEIPSLQEMDGRGGYSVHKIRLTRERLDASEALDYVQRQVFKIGKETGKEGEELFKEILKQESVVGDQLRVIAIIAGNLREGGVEVLLEILKRKNLPDDVLITVINMAKYVTGGQEILLEVLDRKNLPPYYLMEILEVEAKQLREGAEEVLFEISKRQNLSK